MTSLSSGSRRTGITPPDNYPCWTWKSRKSFVTCCHNTRYARYGNLGPVMVTSSVKLQSACSPSFSSQNLQFALPRDSASRYHAFAAAAPGLEKLVERELALLGFPELRAVPGGVECP